MREIKITKGNSKQDGGCNACTEHFDSNGSVEHTVWIITFRYASVRVCKECKEKLIELLGVTE